MAAGEGGLQAWTERNFAEDARIVASGVVLGPGGSVARYDVVAGREELVRLGSMAMPHGGVPIEDYSLTGDVAHAAPLPDGRIVATVRFAEAGSFPSGPGEQAAAAGGELREQLGLRAQARPDRRQDQDRARDLRQHDDDVELSRSGRAPGRSRAARRRGR